MDHLHRDADDVLAVRLTPPSRVLPPSRHALLREPAPPVNASSPPPACQGAVLQLLVRELPEQQQQQQQAPPLTDPSTLGPALSSDWILDPAAFGAGGPPTIEAAAQSGGVRLWPARLQTWSSREWAAVDSGVGLEWMGVELSNVDDASASASGAGRSAARSHHGSQQQQPRLMWRTQHYLVRDGPPRGSALADVAERALDSSLSLRFRTKAPPSSPSTSPTSPVAAPLSSSSPLLSSHLTAHVGIVTNLGAAVQPKHAAKPAHADSMLSANVVLGFESARAQIVATAPASSPSLSSAARAAASLVPAHHWSLTAFGSSDGLAWGVTAFKNLQWRGQRIADGDVASALERLAGSKYALWPWSAPRLQLVSSGAGLEFTYVTAAKDYNLGVGVQHRFRWRPSRNESEAAAAASGTAAAPGAALPLPAPTTVSFSATAMGHLVGSVHAPLTRRWVVSARAHGQLTNGESMLHLGTRLALNDAQSVGISVDSRGGIKAALTTRRRPAPTAATNKESTNNNNRGVSSAFAWMAWLSRRAEVQLHVQAFPLLPALLPAWNVPTSDVMGAWYSRDAALRLQKPQLTIGGSINFEF
jgi:hypothetical protein